MRVRRLIAIGTPALLTCGLVGCTSTPASTATGETSSMAATTASAPGSAPSAADTPSLQIVVTTPILGSIANSIVTCAGQGAVEVLMPNGADPHDFTPSSAQIADLVQADLVIANGLGLESGMQAALQGATADGAQVWEVGPLVDPIPFAEPAPGHAHDSDEHAHEGEGEGTDEHAHGSLDPHIWFDMSRMSRAAALMGKQMQAVTPTGIEANFADCGQQAAAQITAAQTEVRSTLLNIPAERRVLITDHQALGYLADAYDFEIAGAVVESASTLAEPSSADLAQLSALIRQKGVPAIFANVSQPSQLADAVADESQTEVVVVPLFVESLGEPGSPAGDYIGMMRENADRIASGLGS